MDQTFDSVRFSGHQINLNGGFRDFVYMAPEGTGGSPGGRVSAGLTFEQIARIAEASVDAYRRERGDGPRPSWDERPQSYRDAMVRGVRMLAQNPGATAEAMHDMWMSARFLEGWRYGPEYSEADKTHPILVVWDDVPEAQRLKDILFIEVSKTLLGLNSK